MSSAFLKAPSACRAEDADRAADVRPEVALPCQLAGMSLADLRDDYRRRLFDEYLPFWQRGAIDRERGGVFCELDANGAVVEDVKNTTYQGRGLWVYSFLFNHFGCRQPWRDAARCIRDFALRHAYAGQGQWRERTRGDGAVIEGVSPVVLTGLFMAEGLIEHYRAAGDARDLDVAAATVRAAIEQYESPDYDNATATYTVAKVPARGLRSLAHSMVFLRVLQQWPDDAMEPDLAAARDEHLDAIMNRFWHPDFGILNEFLTHDYARFPEYEGCMYSGHALEALWMVLHEAIHRNDPKLFDLAKARLRRLVELSWDFVFEGCTSGDFLVFDLPECSRGPRYEIKTMWAQCEIMIGCMTVLERAGDEWAKDWYERVRRFTLRVMPCEAPGVWRQAVDRRGNNHVRTELGISDKRRDNYHQARYLMYNLLSLERMCQALRIPNTLS